MTLKITKGFVLSLILLFSGCSSYFLRAEVPDYIELGKELEFEMESVNCTSAVFELKNKDIDALRKRMEGDAEYWKRLPSLAEFDNSMSASLKVIYCGSVLNEYSKIFTDMTNNPGSYPNGYYMVSGDDLFIAVLTDEKLVFVFGGN